MTNVTGSLHSSGLISLVVATRVGGAYRGRQPK